MEVVICEYVKNKYGISIKKCCASCLHHANGHVDEKRLCKLDNREHSPEFLCRQGWEMMRPGDPPKQGQIDLDNAGKGGGRVKTPGYIKFVIENGPGRENYYEQNFGSRYLTK